MKLIIKNNGNYEQAICNACNSTISKLADCHPADMLDMILDYQFYRLMKGLIILDLTVLLEAIKVWHNNDCLIPEKLCNEYFKRQIGGLNHETL